MTLLVSRDIKAPAERFIATDDLDKKDINESRSWLHKISRYLGDAGLKRWRRLASTLWRLHTLSALQPLEIANDQRPPFIHRLRYEASDISRGSRSRYWEEP